MKKVLKKRFICKYVNRKTFLGPANPCLSDYRVKCNHSFEFAGVDFAGPNYYNVKNSIYKACLLLFTGLVTKKRGKIKLVSFRTFKSTELKNFLRNNSIEW